MEIKLEKRYKYVGDVFNALVEKAEFPIEVATDLLNGIKDADVVERKRGEWKKMDTTGLDAQESVWNCSNCGYPVGIWMVGSKYCPNCGAIMRDDKKQWMSPMDDRISYGVFWNTKLNPGKWRIFSAWFTSYEAAREEVELALKNPRCIAARIVERAETFESVAEWERKE